MLTAHPPANSMLNDDEVVGRETAEARRAFGVTKAFVVPTTARAEAKAVFMVELDFALVTNRVCGERDTREAAKLEIKERAEDVESRQDLTSHELQRGVMGAASGFEVIKSADVGVFWVT